MMFNKSEQATKKPAMPATNPKGSTPSIIGVDVEIEGHLKTNNEVQLDGRVIGNISCGALVMGETGSVDGDIRADEVTIRGQINGDLRARRVRLEASAVINGDVYHESLTVEAGARLNGRFSYSTESELAAQKAPAAAE